MMILPTKPDISAQSELSQISWSDISFGQNDISI